MNNDIQGVKEPWVSIKVDKSRRYHPGATNTKPAKNHCTYHVEKSCVSSLVGQLATGMECPVDISLKIIVYWHRERDFIVVNKLLIAVRFWTNS